MTATIAENELAVLKQMLEGNQQQDTSADQKQTDQVKWQASLELCLSYRPSGTYENSVTGKTLISRCRHKGPLYVQKPFYPEGDDLAHLYLLHPPGGIVSGDHLHIDVRVETYAKALITTPGAARIYRAREDRALQQQTVNIQLAANSALEWFPLETIVYNDADVALSTKIELEDNANIAAWEITCFGLLASDALFEQGSFQQRYEIIRDGKPVFIDRMAIDDSNRDVFLSAQVSMQSFTVSGFLIVAGFNKDEALLEGIRDMLETTELHKQVAISHVSECLICRYLGDSAEQARKAFTAIWQLIRPEIFERPACEPRIWLT